MTDWSRAGEYSDIRYEKSLGGDAGIAKLTINRPEVRNAFRPLTVIELSDALEDAREDAAQMGLVNTVVPLERLEEETVQWCREMLALSPFSLRLLKASYNAADDGLAGIQQLAHDTNLLFYGSEEAKEGREAFKQKRKPDFSRFPRRA